MTSFVLKIIAIIAMIFLINKRTRKVTLKILLGIARGKKTYDKRESLKKKDIERRIISLRYQKRKK